MDEDLYQQRDENQRSNQVVAPVFFRIDVILYVLLPIDNDPPYTHQVNQ